ncbi:MULTISPECIES: T9SS type A sorting domain-containing protein [Chryseobacterium]|uniref:DUF8202 domain-containing protein n=1 Tax=Chryseobacterium camelliae TaxID=1265445 RepID=A0ABU0TML2_9FLAO|nr:MULTISPECIES: T9SS type A sorting domain-containing protein [Chryseobacterium]MDT3408610.1 hypothetical protein [Pseudacidovorax intermedius]MDQ1097535.1 hypothetical protein [Chryseobacterium camelliae]MDQ1101465.1 hypothetical protein [Chryseobacterium sp. SORGH_AS_1048]MDR6084908.1 hypothetical protein [Chryseobacterium sp. SORGH_AS_0909]MDR6129260.1 hypothetical protein [Chryseobacterium sp. SORGH_AS_1175]
MIKTLSSRMFMALLVSCSFSAYSQLVGSDVQLWEKANPNARESARCKDESLLNFHCGIKDKLLKKYIKYSKDKSHTLSLVHASKEDEMIWEIEDKNVSLSNHAYTKGKSSKEIGKRPSIFSFTGSADLRKEKKDSLRIRFEDQSLYEMIFLPRKAKMMDLNKIHSYLSIKYGISLEKGKYYASDGKVLWDPEKHQNYRYRPTGLGRDDKNELYQKQSSNQADPFLAIGLNSVQRTNFENPSVIDNYNFAMWSDDNKEMSVKPEKDLDVLERNWEISFIGNTIPKTNYTVRIVKEKINPRAIPLSYWMLLKKDNGEIRKLQGVEQESYIIFNNIEFLDAFDSVNTAHFTFAVSPRNNKSEEINPSSGSNTGSIRNINDLSLDINKIALYPNPVKKDQNFTIVFPKMDGLVISIYDAGGRLVKLDKISNTASSYMNHLPIQTSYLINLTQNGKIIKTFKLIVD